jgi:hypothetical protein
MSVLWLAVRIFAALAGAFVGWLLSAAVVRLLVRLAFHRPTPRWVLLLCRIVGAVLIGLLVYYYLHPGGSGGWGLGGGGLGLGGGGSGPGKSGTGVTATVRTATEKTTTEKIGTARSTEKTTLPDTLRVEMLGGPRYKGEMRYYQLEGKEPAQTLEEVEEYLKKNKGRYRRVEIVLYPDSIASEHPEIARFRQLVERYGLLLSISRATRVPPDV